MDTPKNTNPGASLGKQVGYVRVSSAEQKIDRQLVGLQLDKIFIDYVSSSKPRPELEACLDYVREGDTLLVHSIDRMCRNLQELLNIVETYTAKGVTIKFVKDNMEFGKVIDPLDRVKLQMLGAFAEFERTRIRERQKEGYEVARLAGKMSKRRPRAMKLTNEERESLLKLYGMGISKNKLAGIFKISRSTVYDYLDRDKIDKLKASRSLEQRKAETASKL